MNIFIEEDLIWNIYDFASKLADVLDIRIALRAPTRSDLRQYRAHPEPGWSSCHFIVHDAWVC